MPARQGVEVICDYSLASLRTRLAVEGEELFVYRFPTASLGLTSPALEGVQRTGSGLTGHVAFFPYRRVSLETLGSPFGTQTLS